MRKGDMWRLLGAVIAAGFLFWAATSVMANPEVCNPVLPAAEVCGGLG